MGITSCFICSKPEKESFQIIESQIKNENSISMDYFFNLIPKEIIKEMENEKKFNSNNNFDIRTERIIIDENSSLDLKDNIKEILYHGEFNKYGKKEGLGKMIIIKEKENIFYHGIWEKDNLIEGKIYYKDGSTYDGNIQNNKREGIGIFKSDTEEYNGEWKNDQKEGNGHLYFSDETKYEGYFIENKFNGEGTMTWNDGSCYKGEFLNNCFHGLGYLKGNNGHIYEGNFQNGKFHGKGVFKWINGYETESYDGNYSSGQKDGIGKFQFSNGHIFDGNWKSGQPDGEGIYESYFRKYYGNWRSGIFMQLIEVEEKECKEENLNLNFKVPVEDIYVPGHISFSINTSTSVKSSYINPHVTYMN